MSKIVKLDHWKMHHPREYEEGLMAWWRLKFEEMAKDEPTTEQGSDVGSADRSVLYPSTDHPQRGQTHQEYLQSEAARARAKAENNPVPQQLASLPAAPSRGDEE